MNIYPQLLMAVVLAASVVYGQVGRADVLALYNFNGSTVTPTNNPVWTSSTAAAGATPSDMTFGSGLGVQSPAVASSLVSNATGVYILDGAYGTPSQTDSLIVFGGLTSASSTTAAITAGDFFGFTITPASGSSINLTNLTFDWARTHSTNGIPTDWFLTVGSATASPPSQIAATVFLPVSTGGIWSSGTFALSGSISEATTFRIYGYSTTSLSPSSTRSMAFDNITLNGVVVPEPSTLMLAGLGISSLIPFAMRRLRGRKSLAGGDRSSSDENDPGASNLYPAESQ